MNFRGRRKDNGKPALIKGSLIVRNKDAFIFPDLSFPDKQIEFHLVAVHPESLAMATGVLDKNKDEIYGSIKVDGKMSVGGDEIKGWNGFGETKTTKVFYSDGGFYPLCEGEFYWKDIEIIKNNNGGH